MAEVVVRIRFVAYPWLRPVIYLFASLAYFKVISTSVAATSIRRLGFKLVVE